MVKKCILTSFLALSLFSGHGQVPLMDSTVLAVQEYLRKTPQEKIYLRTNKEVFTRGESIWFTAFVLDAVSHRKAAISQLLYVELIDEGNQVLQQLALSVEEGIAYGDFFLADSLSFGTYQVRAYTNYMRNFEQVPFCSRPIQLVNFSGTRIEYVGDEPTMSMRFYPEGGGLIANQVNQVAFKVVDGFGKGLAVEGAIYDEQQRSMVDFASEKFGMGRFLFRPAAGKSYKARITMEGELFEFTLPPARPAGYQFKLRPTTEKVFLTITRSGRVSMEGSFVIGHVRGEVFLALPHIPGQPYIYAPLPLDKLPAGVCQFTFFDGGGQPQAERLLFNRQRLERPKVSMTFKSENTFEQRSLVTLNVAAEDIVGKPLDGAVSVSILNDQLYAPNKINIENYLLLSSELNGEIEHPDYYFDTLTKVGMTDFDLLTLTHGWKRFEWRNVVAKDYPPIRFYPESGFSIEGQVVAYNRRNKGVQSKVNLSFLENIEIQEVAVTEPDGTFWFDGLRFSDTLTAMVRSNRVRINDQGEATDVGGKTFIKMKADEPPAIRNQFPGLFAPYDKDTVHVEKDEAPDLTEEMAIANLKIRNIEAQFDKDVIILDEIEVEGRRDPREDPFFRESILYRSPDSRVVLDSLPGAENFTNVFDLIQGKFPGVEIRGTFPNRSVLIRGFTSIVGDNRALVLIDGVPTNPDTEPSIDPRRVAFIDVLRGSKASIYSASGNGVIAIYTRITNDYKTVIDDPIGFASFTMNGYSASKEFYVPNYAELSGDDLIKPDFRSTLYWNPKVEIVEGSSQLQFYTSDEKSTYTIYVEGVGENGEILMGTTQFQVK